jgi:hypothetical protein
VGGGGEDWPEIQPPLRPRSNRTRDSARPWCSCESSLEWL